MGAALQADGETKVRVYGINKTDRNDARGIAQMMRVGLYRPVHVKTLRSQKLRMLLTHRKLLQSKAIAIENDLRGTLRNFGIKVGMVGKVSFEARIKELVENLPDLRQNITLRRRADADDALRSSAEHAAAFNKVVLAQGLGDANHQAARDEKSDRGPSAPAGCDHAPHLGGWHRIPLDPGTSRRSSMKLFRIKSNRMKLKVHPAVE